MTIFRISRALAAVLTAGRSVTILYLLYVFAYFHCGSLDLFVLSFLIVFLFIRLPI